MENETSAERDLLLMTADIVAAFIVRNKIPADEVPGLITTVASALNSVGQPAAEEAKPVQRLTPAQVRKLIGPTGIISLINQMPFKTLKRHLTLHGYTPESYREAFGLPSDFPMVHPDYAERRSALAKNAGFGTLKVPQTRRGRKPKAKAK